jgi:RNA polymerase sigma factor (sigma-70 family)
MNEGPESMRRPATTRIDPEAPPCDPLPPESPESPESPKPPSPPDPAARGSPLPRRRGEHAMPDERTHRAIDAVWRLESGKVIAHVARLVRDIGLAEELAQDALVSALEHWPVDGLPDNPGAWLMATAKNRALDRLRQDALHARKHEELGHDLDALQAHVVPNFVDALAEASEDDIGDDLLRLVFTACHPVLSMDARVALTLRLISGLTTAEIARAYLQPESTIAQRIVRAKRTLTEARVPFEVPRAAELPARLASVLEVIYLVFNEGYSATAGDDWMRPALCAEALRLGSVVATLMPAESEVLGLVALMEIQASRTAARTDAQGRAVLLMDQDRSRWDTSLIRRGLQSLERAEALGGAHGPYALQAALAACHARASDEASTDWVRIVALYDALAQVVPSPVVELNRAVAVGRAYGPEAGLAIVDSLAAEPALGRYHWLPSVRGDLLARLGRHDEARAEFERAAELTRNVRERELLTARAQAVATPIRH